MHSGVPYYPYNLAKMDICKYQIAFDDNSIAFKF